MVEPLPYTVLYDGWTLTQGDAKEVLRRSADRYVAHLQGKQTDVDSLIHS